MIYLICVLKIFDMCAGDIGSVYWRNLTCVLEIFDGVLEISDPCPIVI